MFASCFFTLSYRICYSFADGPIDASKLANPSSSKTTALLASLITKDSLNDHGDSGSEEGEGGPDPLRVLVETVRVAYRHLPCTSRSIRRSFCVSFFFGCCCCSSFLKGLCHVFYQIFEQPKYIFVSHETLNIIVHSYLKLLY